MLTRLRTIPVPALAALAAVLVSTAAALVFFYAPVAYDAEVHAPDFAQKIFYFHVQMALTAYAFHTSRAGRPSSVARCWSIEPAARFGKSVTRI